jgi:serine protease Do
MSCEQKLAQAYPENTPVQLKREARTMSDPNIENNEVNQPDISETSPEVQPENNTDQPAYIHQTVLNDQPAVDTRQPAANSEQPDKKSKKRRIAALSAAFLAVAILFSASSAAVVYTMLKPQSSQVTQSTDQTSSTTSTDQQSNSATNKFYSIADAAAKTDPNKKTLTIMEIAAKGKPAVVAISTETSITNPFGQTGIVPAAGSGFILTADGYIVTNHHVIDGAQKITVMLDNGKSYPAKLVGSDSQNDIAVLKIDGKDLPTVTLGDSASLQVGELAVAIGNPLGELSGTVTAGIISALDRTVTIENQTMTLLQTDAAINAGNSGGALLNSFGEVIGINTAKNAGTGIEGLGFAIPIDHAKPIIESLIKNGYIPGRPRIGIYTQDITAAMAQQNQTHEGIYVAQVTSGGTADKAGIKTGDIIIAANDKEVLTTEALNNLKNSLKPGDTIKMTIIRAEKQISVTVTLEEALPSAA